MATLSLTVKSYKRSDGTYQVAISLCHKSKTCYIPTPVYVTSPSHLVGASIKRESESLRKTKILIEMLQDYKQRLESISYIEDYTCAQLKKMLESQVQVEERTLGDVVRERMQELDNANKASSSAVIRNSYSRWHSYIGDTKLCHITPTMIRNFDNFLHDLGKYKEDTISITLRTIKALINYSIRNQYVSYKVHPYINTTIHKGAVRDLPLTLNDFTTIYNCAPNSEKGKLARDMFLLSFFLGGINMGDVVTLDYRAGDDSVTYVRTKTSGRTAVVNETTMPVIPDAEAVLGKYCKNGRLALSRMYEPTNFAHYVSQCMGKLNDEVTFENRLVIYSARKGFAQFALDLGFSDAVVDYCLGHSNSNRGIIAYYNKVRVTQARQCLQTVADYVLGRLDED